MQYGIVLENNCSWVVLWIRIGPILFTNTSCRCCSFWCISLMCWDCFSNVMVSLAFRKLDQTISRSPNRDHDLSFGASLALKSALELLLRPASELVVTVYHIKSFHYTSQSNGEMVLCHCIEQRRWHFKTMVFLICGPLIRHPLIELFHLSNLLQRPNNHSMVDAEFFGNFSGSCKRISLDDSLNWSLSTSDAWPPCSSSARLSSPLQNFLNHHCTAGSLAVPEPHAA